MPRVPPRLTALARELRHDATLAERKFWGMLSRYQPPFTRQLRVGNAILDLACREAKVAVELDGGHHALQQDADAERTARLEALGWIVVRLWNNEVLENPEGAARHVLEVVAERIGTHPQPLPSREGRERRPRSRAIARDSSMTEPQATPLPDKGGVGGGLPSANISLAFPGESTGPTP